MKLQVVGLGKLGLPFAHVLAQSGFDVIGVDPIIVDKSGHLRRTTTEKGIVPHLPNLRYCTTPVHADVHFVIVPTPSINDGSFDTGLVQQAIDDIGSGATLPRRANPLINLVSTVSPGTCEQLEIPEQYQLVYNPTFIALGSVVADLLDPALLLLGGEEKPRKIIREIWTKVGVREEVIHETSSYTEVELIKLSLNAALATKISLANSLGLLFERYGVRKAAVQVIGEDPRIGSAYFHPGGPVGGPCLPRDNKALQAAAKAVNFNLPLTHATDEINRVVAHEVIWEVLSRKPMSVGFLGYSYKYGVMSKDPSLTSILLANNGLLGTRSRIYDPIFPDFGDLESVLDCDVIVVTQPELRQHVPAHLLEKVVDPWPS